MEEDFYPDVLAQGADASSLILGITINNSRASNSSGVQHISHILERLTFGYKYAIIPIHLIAVTRKDTSLDKVADIVTGAIRAFRNNRSVALTGKTDDQREQDAFVKQCATKVNRMKISRKKVVKKIKKKIQANEYENDLKLSVACDNLLMVLVAQGLNDERLAA